MDGRTDSSDDGYTSLPFHKRYFAKRVIHPWMRPGIMRKHIYTGAMGTVYFNLISGMFWVYYATHVGMTPAQFALMGSGAAFLLTVQLVSAQLTQRHGNRKWLWFWCSLGSRSCRLVGIAVSFYLWQHGLGHIGAVLMGAVWFSSLFGALAYPPWMSWLADIIPEDEHGGFWGRRTAWINGALIVAGLSAAVVMDDTPERHKLTVSLFILMGAGIVGLLDILIHGTIPEPHMTDRNHESFLKQVLEPLRDRAFRPWLVFNCTWTYSMWMGGILAWMFFIRELNIDRSFLGGILATTVVSQLVGVFTSARTGRAVDRLGPRKVLTWAHLFWSFHPLFWMLATFRTVFLYLGAISVLSGVTLPAAMTAANKLITRFPKPGHRAMYIAVSTCLGSLFGGLGALTASGIMWLLADWHLHLPGRDVNAFYVVFSTSLVLRLLVTVFLLHRINDPAQGRT